MNRERLKYLFQKYTTDILDKDEYQELMGYLDELSDEEFSSLVDSLINLKQDHAFDKERIFQNIISQGNVQLIKKEKSSTSKMTVVISIAASLLLLAAFSVYTLRFKNETTVNVVTQIPSTLPAVLSNSIVLADGKNLDLEKDLKDTVNYKGLSLVKLSDGTLSVSKDQSHSSFDENSYHTFRASKGATLKVLLPDATKVLLNSGSQIDISAAYGVYQREVRLVGEGFFDVTHNRPSPFIVQAKNAKINVLGTSFNVSAYNQDNEVKTTLVEGAVALTTVSQEVKIAPGQQAIVGNTASIHLIRNIDIANELAWKEGYFSFKDESIANLLREMSKWYDIQHVEIAGDIKDKFTGRLKRTTRLKDILEALQQVSSLKFETQEGRVKVMK